MNNRKKIFFILLTALSFIFINFSTGKNMNPLYNQPIFKLSINTYGVKHIVNINGVSILKDLDEGGQSETSLPINHLFRSGENTIELYIFPEVPGHEISHNSRANITLNISNKKNTDIEIPITEIDFIGAQIKNKKQLNGSSRSGRLNSNKDFIYDADGDIEIFDIKSNEVNGYSGAIKLVRKVNIDSSLPLWKFFTSEELPDYNSMPDDDYYDQVDSLLIEYMKVQNSIKTKNIDNIIPLFSERNAELDAAFYQPNGTHEKKIRDSLAEAANDNGLELVDLKREYVNIKVEDNNKLISLNRNGFKAAIALNFKEGIGTQRYPLIFRLSNKHWILTR